MPMFDYRCPRKPFVTFDRLVRRPEDTPRCQCGDRDCKPQRLVSAPAFTLKGDGWYRPGTTV